MTAPPRPALTIRRPPRLDGPYDDEVPDLPVVDGTVPFAFPPPIAAGLPIRLAPPAMPRATGDAAELGDPRPLSRRLAQAVVEVLAGARPPAQLAGYATLDVLGLLERWAGRLGGRRHSPATTRPVVSSVHLSQPSPGVAEACAVVDTGPRRRAIALRLEGRNGRWRCTALQVG